MTVMPRFVLALTLTLTAFTFVLALTARAWGGTEPPHPALRGFVEGCEGLPQPCWYGIVPGETAVRDVIAILSRQGYAVSERAGSMRIYTSLSPSQLPGVVTFGIVAGECSQVDCTTVPIMYLYLFYWNHVGLGDVMNTLGFPSRVFDGTTEYHLVFGASYLEAIPQQAWSSPFHLVKRLLLPAMTEQETGQPWHGFVRMGQYCRLEPAFGNCD
jgi:hypothetical protein